jgi:hypothetical protein
MGSSRVKEFGPHGDLLILGVINVIDKDLKYAKNHL